MTNADRIRAMSDEELADLFSDVFDCDHHECVAECGECSKCTESWLKWLKQEATDNA